MPIKSSLNKQSSASQVKLENPYFPTYQTYSPKNLLLALLRGSAEPESAVVWEAVEPVVVVVVGVSGVTPGVVVPVKPAVPVVAEGIQTIVAVVPVGVVPAVVVVQQGSHGLGGLNLDGLVLELGLEGVVGLDVVVEAGGLPDCGLKEGGGTGGKVQLGLGLSDGTSVGSGHEGEKSNLEFK